MELIPKYIKYKEFVSESDFESDDVIPPSFVIKDQYRAPNVYFPEQGSKFKFFQSG